MTKKTDAIQPFTLSTDLVNAADLLRENLGDEALSRGSLFKLTVPGSGGKFWEIIDPETGEESSAKSVRGVILGKRKTRVYFSKPFGGDEKNVPDCSSEDGKVGTPNLEILEEDPEHIFHPYLADGGEKVCASCPLNEFTKDEKGRTKSKPCQERIELVLLLEGTILPSILSVPPGSLRNFSDYMTRLTQVVTPFHSVVTEFGLEKVEQGGNTFSKVTFANIRKLTDEERGTIAGYKAAILA